MARALRAVVSRDRAHAAIVELLEMADRPQFRESISGFSARLVDQGINKTADEFTWRHYVACEILDFVEGTGNTVLRCEERRKAGARARREAAQPGGVAGE